MRWIRFAKNCRFASVAVQDATVDGLGKFVPAEVLPPDETPDREYPFIQSTGRQLRWPSASLYSSTRARQSTIEAP